MKAHIYQSLNFLLSLTAIQLSVITCLIRDEGQDCNQTFVNSYGANTPSGLKVLDYLHAKEQFIRSKAEYKVRRTVGYKYSVY